MDRASEGFDLRLLPPLPPGLDRPWAPQDRASAMALVVRGDDLMDESEPEQALTFYQAAASAADRDVVAAAYFGTGNALYRIDRDAEARQAWEHATTLGETPITYRAWRQVAAALVREGDLQGALKAYRQCERRAPREDRAEIASRLGWLNKETGNTGAAARHFARSRGDALPPLMTYAVILVTALASVASITGAPDPYTHSMANGTFFDLYLNKLLIAHGDYYRLLTVMLVHDPTSITNFILHLGFNMYALWFAGQLVERMYGSALMVAMYVVSGLAGSVCTYVFGDAVGGYGASGAVFGMFGATVVATRYHHAILDARSRAIATQIGGLIVLNLVIGFAGILPVDNFAHVGGLVAGMWLAFVIPPGQVATLGSLWQGRRDVAGSRLGALATRFAGVALLLAIIGAGIVAGTSRWQADPQYRYYYGSAAGPPAIAAEAAAAPVARIEVD
jgi:membrane associated rhomboid family serine protease